VYAGLRVDDGELRRGTRGVRKACHVGVSDEALRFRPAVLNSGWLREKKR
jgi:hypothetical protein